MHILFLTPAYPPFPGGGERYVSSLAKTLSARGHKITVVTSQAEREDDFWYGRNDLSVLREEDGIQVLRCPLHPLPGRRYGLLAWRKMMVVLSMLPRIDQNRTSTLLGKMAQAIPPIKNLPQTFQQVTPVPDIVHGFNISWEYPLLAGWRWAQKQKPFVATPFMHLGTGPQDRTARNSTMPHQLNVLRQAQAVLTLTHIESTGLIAYGIPSSLITTVGSGLDPLPAPSISSPDRWPESFVLFVGRTSFEKGAITAAQSILSLRQSGTAVTLLLAGQPSPEFNRFYAQLSPTEQTWIRPLGIISDAEKHTLLAACRFLLLPSRTDSFGIVLLEAWAYGKPVIGAQAGGIPGVIDHMHNGLLVPFGNVTALANAIAHLWTHPEECRRLGINGQQKVNKVYTWDSVADKVLTVYKELS